MRDSMTKKLMRYRINEWNPTHPKSQIDRRRKIREPIRSTKKNRNFSPNFFFGFLQKLFFKRASSSEWLVRNGSTELQSFSSGRKFLRRSFSSSVLPPNFFPPGFGLSVAFRSSLEKLFRSTELTLSVCSSLSVSRISPIFSTLRDGNAAGTPTVARLRATPTPLFWLCARWSDRCRWFFSDMCCEQGGGNEYRYC